MKPNAEPAAKRPRALWLIALTPLLLLGVKAAIPRRPALEWYEAPVDGPDGKRLHLLKPLGWDTTDCRSQCIEESCTVYLVPQRPWWPEWIRWVRPPLPHGLIVILVRPLHNKDKQSSDSLADLRVLPTPAQVSSRRCVRGNTIAEVRLFSDPGTDFPDEDAILESMRLE